MTYKPVKQGMTKPAPRVRLPDEDDHQRLLDRARSEKERKEIERMRDVLAASRKKPTR